MALAREGLSTLVVEMHRTPGGGTRSSALTLPGFVHDVCSAVHPLGAASPFFASIGLERHGVAWVQPDACVAHVMGRGDVVTLERSVDATAEQMGPDANAYREVFGRLTNELGELLGMVLGPLRIPSSPMSLARFGLSALRSMRGFARSRFRGVRAKALLGGIAAHSMVPLDRAATASFALVLGAAGHAVGWPLARGGSESIADALVACHSEHGGEIVTNTRVERLDQLPRARAYLFDVAPKTLLGLAGDRLPAGYRRRLERYRYGPGVFKMDWALGDPIPWRDPACRRAATVHLSGTLDAIAEGERRVHAGGLARRPFVLLVQPTLFDPTRAPPGRHVAWAYCHVPAGSTIDASALIEEHIEEFAPGFRDTVLARATRDPQALEEYDPNYVGGDINAGVSDLGQLFFRPVARLDPYATPVPGLYLCSSSTPPGGGVHGMCGYFAAQSALAHIRRRSSGGGGTMSP